MKLVKKTFRFVFDYAAPVLWFAAAIGLLFFIADVNQHIRTLGNRLVEVEMQLDDNNQANAAQLQAFEIDRQVARMERNLRQLMFLQQNYKVDEELAAGQPWSAYVYLIDDISYDAIRECGLVPVYLRISRSRADVDTSAG